MLTASIHIPRSIGACDNNQSTQVSCACHTAQAYSSASAGHQPTQVNMLENVHTGSHCTCLLPGMYVQSALPKVSSRAILFPRACTQHGNPQQKMPSTGKWVFVCAMRHCLRAAAVEHCKLAWWTAASEQQLCKQSRSPGPEPRSKLCDQSDGAATQVHVVNVHTHTTKSPGPLSNILLHNL